MKQITFAIFLIRYVTALNNTPYPTLQPITIEPTKVQLNFSSLEPSESPIYTPTIYPSTAPTYHGVAGVEWWYYTMAAIEILWQSNSDRENPIYYSDEDIVSVITYSFSFSFRDNLNQKYVDGLIVSSKVTDFNRHPQRVTSEDTHAPINTQNYTCKMILETWTIFPGSLDAIRNELINIVEEPNLIIIPAHENGLTGITHINITLLTSTISIIPPTQDIFDDDDIYSTSKNGSPVKIMYIIFGTLILFALFVSFCHYINQATISMNITPDTTFIYQSPQPHHDELSTFMKVCKWLCPSPWFQMILSCYSNDDRQSGSGHRKKASNSSRSGMGGMRDASPFRKGQQSSVPFSFSPHVHNGCVTINSEEEEDCEEEQDVLDDSRDDDVELVNVFTNNTMSISSS